MFGGIPEKELNELNNYWEAFPSLKNTLFSEKSESNYAALKVADIKSTITEHTDVKTFVNHFNTAFSNFDSFLKNELLSQMETVNISKEETILGEDIFSRLSTIPLIDKYEAYQLLDDNWLKVAIDLEIIQTEGKESTKKVDPNMIVKKVKGKEQEVQDGWKGRIMPFELVQETYLKDELESLKQKENRLLEITAEYEETFESLSEEEKETDIANDAADAFVNAKVIKTAKQLKAEAKKNGAFAKDTYEAKILKVDSLITEEKELKKQVKAEAEKLHLLTKETIQSLTDEQILELLERKWISPLVSSLNNLPEVIINELTAKVQQLTEKYATTYAHVAEEIHQTENSLASLIDDLTGNEFDMKGLSEFKSFLKGE
jgi:type I restriction enzyme M protein